ncbi:MAG: FecR domain-containing protein [Oligoflexia bacterium]|nr:FecR domain-containing protein [Oligoflexia bacterium]
MKNIILVFVLLFSSQVMAALKKTAKVTLLRGKVEFVSKALKKKGLLKKGQWLYEGDHVKSQKKGVARLLMMDKSSVTVAPNSSVIINSAPGKKPGMVTLLTGKLKAKVRPNYKKKSKNKFLVKTKNSALGVRGTEFIANFDPKLLETSTITFSGSVAMVGITEVGEVNIDKLMDVLDSDDSVIVNAGEVSTVQKDETKPSQPIVLSPIDLYKLKQKVDVVKSTIKANPGKTVKVNVLNVANFLKGETKKVASLPKLSEVIKDATIVVEDEKVEEKPRPVLATTGIVVREEENDLMEVEQVAELSAELPVQNLIKLKIRVQ